VYSDFIGFSANDWLIPLRWHQPSMTVVILKISLKKSREFEKEFKKFAKKKKQKKNK